MSHTIIVLEGDQTGQELLDESLRVLDPAVIGFELDFIHYDLSLENRRATKNGVVHDAAKAIREHGLGLKAATITPPIEGDVGSPNRILREQLDAEIIMRAGRRIPGITPIAGVFSPITVMRSAVGGAYGAKEWREEADEDGDIEYAYRTERISRWVCRAVSEYTFQFAQRTGAKVFGGPKYTVSATYEMMLKEEMDAAAERYPEVAYDPQLIDATFALLLKTSGEPLVVPTLNRDGDLLSDMVLQMFGTIAGSESLVISVNKEGKVDAVMAEAPHGTAPTLEGLNVANPMAMILAQASLLEHIDDPKAKLAGRAIREATLEAVHQGICTADLKGSAKTDEFTNEVIKRTKTKLDVWATLG